ncbi:RICIN domain-containing protein [Kribbella sp. CA-293567]|uniref:RICIN domain-containing protein n=1 Tax=Kribbella sp. CA-293567 TaxID=3002436 RepID=UPI0022DD3357|nr:RICIN domain-containing protein [Kribbella sp. CA-293567]WBQ07907.1 RICIN domain-containing protein [Kribbella sp. CA-293567]
MSPSRQTALVALLSLGLAFGGIGPATSAPPAGASYTITVGAKGTWSTPTDTPAGTFVDKDGTFYFQQSAALYGASDPRKWDFYTGTNFDTATRSTAISNAVNPANASDKNNDTTWRCNNSPTGLKSTYAPSGSGYSQRNYCDLAGVWIDPDTGDWYGLVHNEFTPQPFGDGLHYDAIDYAVSTNQGKTWTIKDHAITSPYSTKRNDTAAFPNQTYSYGDGDQRLFVDTASGYFYVYYGSRIVDKSGSWKNFRQHVARAKMSAKMAPSSWQKWYDGAWTEPGVGGRESNLVPVDASNPNGYTPLAKEYKPSSTGTADQQVAAGTLSPTSPLFVMDIAYNVYLGLYVGEPQAVRQDGKEPQHFYVTDDLTSQKWYSIGNTGSYTTASWYRWFLDSVNKTSSTIIGKNFRSYCSFGCSGGSSGEYVNLTITSTSPAAAPLDLTKTYRIANAGGRILAQQAAGTGTTSVGSASGSALESWYFVALGDGSYQLLNSSTGHALGVDAGTTASRAWGTKPTVTAIGAGGPTVGQQWWLIKNTGGTLRLVNRYSGLVLGLSADSGRLAETTPPRDWTNTTGNSVGGSRSGAEQTLSVTQVGTAPQNLNGLRTVSTGGKALDNPNHSTTAGTPLNTWTSNGGANQKWQFTQQTDGSYELVNSESGLCADVSDNATTAGAKVIQWTCTKTANQRWNVTRLASGAYTLASARSGLLLTTAATSDGAAVTQQANTGTALQQWTIS